MNPQSKNKLILALLLLTPILVMLAATVTFKIGYVPEHKKNNGVLLHPPLALEELVLTDNKTQNVFNYQQMNKEYGRWHLFIFADSRCQEKACIDTLWLTRQLHIALAHRAQYLSRYYVSVGAPINAALEDYFKKEHPRLQWLTTSEAHYKHFITQSKTTEFSPLAQQQIVLVDPNGWMMMYYDEQHTGQDIIQDLKYLLKKRGK